MHRKAQAELALILGLFIIAAVVGIYAFSSVVPTTTQPSALSDEQKAVDTFVKDAIRRASGQTLTAMYNQGGHAETTGVRHIEYAGNEIAYWQTCGDVSIPDVERNLETHVENLLKSSLPARTDIAGKIVTFDKSQVSADAHLFDNRITVSVTLPTVFGGQAMPQPYTIDIRSSLGRINDFSSDFARFQAKYRALDYNLLKLIPVSNPKTEPESCWLPTKGAEFKSSFSKGWGELRDCMQRLIIHNLAHTYEWQKPTLVNGYLPTSTLDDAWIFQIVKSDGTWGQYKELDIDFYFGGEGKQLSRSNPELLFGTSPDPVDESGESFSMLGYNMGPMLAYDVKYHVSYPVVVSVWDPLLERSFKFTTFVNIKNSQASSDCKLEGGIPSEYYERCIKGATEDMRLTVLDHDDEALSGVKVWYDSCGPWMAYGGDLDTKIPSAASGELRLLHEFSSSEYRMCIGSGELSDKTVRLPIKQVFDLNFYVVKMQKSPLRITSIERTRSENITAMFTRPGNPCMNSTKSIAANYGMWGGIEEISKVVLYPSEPYDVEIITDGRIDMQDLVVTGNEGVLNVYAPSLAGFTDSDVQSVMDLYERCNMQPVSTELYVSSKAGCSL